MRINRYIKKHWVSFASVLLFLTLWQIGSDTRFLPVDYVGSPIKIFEAFAGIFKLETMKVFLIPSLIAMISGLTLAIIIGVILGFAIGTNQTVRKIFQPFLFAINAIPAIVFFPLIIIAFGISLQSVILTIVLMCFVPVMINVVAGVSHTDSDLIEMAQSFGADNFFILKKIIFFSTLPYIFAGIKAAIGKATIALIVAEIFGMNMGIGYLISLYGSTFRVNELMALVLLLLLLNGILLFLLWGSKIIFRNYLRR